MPKPVEKAEGVPECRIIHGDCVQVMREMEPNSVDAVVCDPPYGLEFMQANWDAPWKYTIGKTGYTDGAERLNRPSFGSSRNPMCRNCRKHQRGSKNHEPCSCDALDFDGSDHKRSEMAMLQAWHETWAREAIRVLKPGGHLLAFGGTRTYHRLVCALEDAGFEIVDCIQWIYGQGFNKVGKTGKKMYALYNQKQRAHGRIPLGGTETMQRHMHLAGSLKPAHEPVVLARKPLSASSVARQVLQNGCGALNVDATRVATSSNDPNTRTNPTKSNGLSSIFGLGDVDYGRGPQSAGRFPSNFLLSHVPGPNGCQRVGTKRVKGNDSPNVAGQVGHAKSMFLRGSLPLKKSATGHADSDGFEEVESWECVENCPILELDRQSGMRKSGERKPVLHSTERAIYGQHKASGLNHFEASEGGASRFFKTFGPDAYCQEPPENDNSDVLSSQNDDSAVFEPDTGLGFVYQAKASRRDRTANGAVENKHSTVKPTALMRYLLRMVVSPGSTVLDPFLGSGSTLVAACELGIDAIGIEQDLSYAETARQRIAHAQAETLSRLPL